MENIIIATIGGALIGISSSIILYSLGRIAGISGVLASAFLYKPHSSNTWKYFFILGLIIGGLIMKAIHPSIFNYGFPSSLPITIIAGLLVGFGTRLGSGCTSGHGVCGLPRGSLRSLIATITFIGAGIITVYIKGAM